MATELNQCYEKLNSSSTIKEALLNFATSADTAWIRRNAFDIAMVPQHIIVMDTVAQKLITAFKATPVIFRMPAWQFYRFHTDAARSSALNMLLSGTDSQTYYGTVTNSEEVMDIKELVYEPNSYYLLNTHLKHAVVNRNNVRYMFSIGFNEPRTYADILGFCRDNNL